MYTYTHTYVGAVRNLLLLAICISIIYVCCFCCAFVLLRSFRRLEAELLVVFYVCFVYCVVG